MWIVWVSVLRVLTLPRGGIVFLKPVRNSITYMENYAIRIEFNIYKITIALKLAAAKTNRVRSSCLIRVFFTENPIFHDQK